MHGKKLRSTLITSIINLSAKSPRREATGNRNLGRRCTHARPCFESLTID